MSLIIRLRDAVLLSLAVIAIARAPAAFAQTPTPPPVNLAEQQLLLRLVSGVTLEHYLEALSFDFANLDADGDGKLTQRDVELHTLMEAIGFRLSGWTAVMRFDLDGDGFVTVDEMRRTAAYDFRASRAQAARGQSPLGGTEEIIDRMVTQVMALDTDKDGKVSLAEAAKFGEGPQRQNAAINGHAVRTRQALTLEAATAGELSRAAYEAAGEALFRRVDTDNDGKISQQELTDYRKPGQAAAKADAADAAQKRQRELAELTQKRQAAIDLERSACAMPAVSEKARVVLLGAYEAEALSNVTIGSQDAVVLAGRINVEPGNEPLYIVITSFIPTIWQFGGAVERIERVVLTSWSTGRNNSDPKQPPVAGATGVARDRVSFLSRSNCMNYFYETPASNSLQAAGAVRAVTGRAPDVIAGQYALSTFNVPSGKIDSVKDQSGQRPAIRKGSNSIVGPGNIIIQFGPSRASDDALMYWPGGVVEIDPKAVIATAPVVPYDVLPAQAGLAQLLANGGVTQNKAGEYIVRSKMRFPPGLYGAHSVTFLVMKGAPYPDGDPGHSCVIVEETGESKGAGCRSR